MSPSRSLPPSLFGVGRFPRLFIIVFRTNVLKTVEEPTELAKEGGRRLCSPRLPSLLALACLLLKAFKELLIQVVPLELALLGGRRWVPHLNPASLWIGQLVQGVPWVQHHFVLEVLFLQMLQESPLAMVVKSLTLTQSLELPQVGHSSMKD
jgi:hypothetical protein